jgi:predicted RNase H-like nuclease
MNSQGYRGIDGAPGGWISVTWRRNKFKVEFQERLSLFSFQNTISLIDMPIGLPISGYRQCDLLGRRLLGAKRSSLFLVPSREAVFAKSYLESCENNLTKQNVKLSKQTWNICPKIKELDELLRSEPDLKESLLEAHPEIAFSRLNQNQPLRYSKKTLEGRQERINLLMDAFDPVSINELIIVAKSSYPKLVEDILDASSLVGLLMIPGKKLEFLGESNRDRYGLPMQIAC